MTDSDYLGPIGNATPKYESSNPVVRKLLARFLQRVDETAARLAPTSVLDVGCGEGVVTERLARRLAPAEVLGVDDASLRGEWQTRSEPNLSFATGSAYDLDFADRSFDLVCAIEVLEHLEQPREALAELRRVSGRTLLLSVPNEPLWRTSHFLAGRDVRSLGNTPGHLNHWSKRSFLRLAGELGTARAESVFPWTLAVVDTSAPVQHDDPL